MRLSVGPYPFDEFLSMVWRRFTPRPPSTLLEYDLEKSATCPHRWIGFVGDICPSFGREIIFAPELYRFFEDCDSVVGNFEGVLTERRWRPFLMKHTPSIFDSLARLCPLKRWILSVANNHIADYGPLGLTDTLDALNARGIRWVGTPDCARISLEKGVTLTAWTWWTNRPTQRIMRQDPGPPREPGVHIAFPHWGYEHEREPRLWQRPPEGYTLTAGHHSHLPQPFEQTEDDRLVAWSLGNFVTGKRLPTLGEGAVLKIGLVTQSDGAPMIGKASFRPIILDRDTTACRVRMLHAI